MPSSSDLDLKLKISANPADAVDGLLKTREGITRLDDAIKAQTESAAQSKKEFIEAAREEAALVQKIGQIKRDVDALGSSAEGPKAIKDAIKALNTELAESDKDVAKLTKELAALEMQSAKPLSDKEAKELAASFDYLFAEMEKGKGKSEALRYEIALAAKALESSELAARQAKEQQARLKDELKADTAALKDLSKATADADMKMQSASAASDKLSRELDQLKQSEARQSAALKDAGINVQHLALEYERLGTAARKAAQLASARDTLGIKPFADIEAEITRVRQAFETLQTSGKLSQAEIAQAALKTQQRIDELRHSTNEAGTQTKRTTGLLSELGQVAGTVLAGFSVTSFYEKLKSITVELQSLDAQMKGMTAGSEDFANLQRDLARVAGEHHKSLLDLADSEKRLLAIEDAGILTRQENLAIFEGMSNAQSKFGATSDQLKQSLYGLSQALASPVVHAEELSQVVEPLPGLMAKLDAASGQAAGGFRRLVNEGRITNTMFKDVLMVALKDYEGAAAGMGDTLQAKLTDVERAFQKFSQQSRTDKFASEWADNQAQAWTFWGDMIDSSLKKADAALAAWHHRLGEPSEAEFGKEFEQTLERIHLKFGQNTAAIKEHKAALDMDIDSVTGLHSAERITGEVLDGLLQKLKDAQAAVAAKTQAQAEGKATQDEVNQATQAAKKAEADYVLEVGKAKDQLDQAAKSSSTYTAQIQSQATTTQSLLKSQIDSLQLAAQEAEAAGRHSQALDFEAQAIQKAGELRRAEIRAARDMLTAKTNEAIAAREYADEVERNAKALDGVTVKERAEIDAARASAAEKRSQADAERLHLAELTRLPVAFDQYKSAQLSSNAAVRAAYTEAKTAWQEADRLAKAQRDGSVSAEASTVAQEKAAVALAKVDAASRQASEGEKYLAEVQKNVSASVSGEVMQHNAAVSAQRRQNAAEEQAQAQARRQAASAEIHDGEQLQIMYASMAQEFNRFGETGAAALKAIEDGLGLGKYQWDVWTHAASTWIDQADKQAEAVDRLTGNLQTATQTGYGLGNAIAAASKNFDKMDENHLEKLNAALDAAKAKVRELEDSIAGRLNSLADELDRKLGNEQAIERRRYEEQQKQIKQDVEVAKGLGSKEALAKAKEEQRIAKQIHDLNMKEAQARQQEAQQAKAQAPAAPSQAAPPQHAGTVNFDALVNGQKIPLQAESTVQVHTLIKQIGRAGQRTVRR